MEAIEIRIKVKPEYKALIPEPSEKDFAATEESIVRNGLYEKIVVNKEGYILDGHTRYKICQMHNIEPKFIGKNFRTEAEEMLYIISANVMRCHLNPVQRSLIALKLKPIFEEIAKQNQSKGGKGVTIVTPLKRVDESLAKSAGVSRGTIRRVEKLQKEASPKLLEEAIRTGKADKALNTHKREQARKQLIEEAKQSKELPENVSITCGDFRIVGQKIRDNSIDNIFVDPLYYKESLDDYRDPAVLAERVLKPGASIVFYVGHAIIPQVISHFLNAGLQYHWILAVTLQGPFARAHGGKVRITHKILLWFRKGDKVKINYEIHDLIESQRPQKEMMDWEQSVIEAGHVIKGLTVENQIVLDPMMGSGTTGEAALKLKRKLIGIERDGENFAKAQSRLAK